MVRSLILELNTLKLVRVNGSNAHALILYNILKKRDTKTNISHKKIPTLKQHVNFINSLPYRYWFIIKKSSSVLGSIYVTRSNEISISLLKKSTKNFSEVLSLITNSIKPLPAIASKRNGKFILNLSPSNKFYNKLLKSIGAKKIQETFLLSDSNI